MNFNKYIFRAFIFSVVVFSQISLAVSPRVDLIDLEKNLSDNRYSPVLGYKALESHILKHLREDLPEADPLRGILWTLFPHPQEHGVTRRNMEDCFGVEVKKPDIIQSLFHYLIIVRRDPALIQAMEQFYTGGDEIEVISSSDHNTKQKFSKKRLERECYSYIDQFKSYHQKLLKSGPVHTKIKSPLESEFTFKKHVFKMIQLKKYVEFYFAKTDNKTQNKVPNKKFITRTLKPLLNNINQYLILENKNHYPNYFLEAVLWAFSIQHFQSEELLQLRNGLNESISSGACEFSHPSAQEIADKYDDLLQGGEMFNFSDYILSKIRLLPMHIYTAGFYAPVNVYNRATCSFENETFTDCTESSILGLLAFILFDRHENKFVLDSLLKRQESLPDQIKENHNLTFLIDYFKLFDGRESYHSVFSKNRNFGNRALASIPNVSYLICRDDVANEIRPKSNDILRTIYGLLNEPNKFSSEMTSQEFNEALHWALVQIRPELQYKVSSTNGASHTFKVMVSEEGPPETILGTFQISSTGTTCISHLQWSFTCSPLETKVLEYFGAQDYNDVRGLMSLQARACPNRHTFLERYKNKQL